MKKLKFAVVDYGAGNLGSIARFIHALGGNMETIKSIRGQSKIDAQICVIPGVGNFGYAMGKLEANGLVEYIHHFHKKKKLSLGMCLGAQLLLENSEESPGARGLGFIAGKNLHLSKNPAYRGKTPRIGWQNVSWGNQGKKQQAGFYFMHSYEMVPQNQRVVWGRSADGVNALIHLDHLWGVQPHPEKSQLAGFRLIREIIKNHC